MSVILAVEDCLNPRVPTYNTLSPLHLLYVDVWHELTSCVAVKSLRVQDLGFSVDFEIQPLSVY